MKPIKDDDERNLQSDIKRKTIRIPPPKKVADALSKLMSRHGYARVLSVSALDANWQKAAGERLAAHSRPGKVQRGVLEVLVRSSAVLQELTFSKSQLIKQLQASCPEQKLRDLKFKVTTID